MNTITKKLSVLLALPLAMPIFSLANAENVDYASKVKEIIEQKPDFDPILSENYNVEWTTQSSDSSQSMPVGGHDVGLNVWVENNSLYFYISKSDAIDENNVFGKLGRVKIDLNPNPFAEGTSFSQKLVLKDGHCDIKATGKDGNEVTIRLWVDAFKPVIHVDITSAKDIRAKAEYHNWRFEEMEIPMVSGFRESNDYGTFSKSPKYNIPYTQHPDKCVTTKKSVTFYHKNNNDDLTMEKAIKEVGLADSIERSTWHDPATNFTFGGVMLGKNMSLQGEPTKGTYMKRDYIAHTLVSDAPAKQQSITIALHTGQYEKPADWNKALKASLAKVNAKEDRAKTIAWWHKIWNRSHIMINAETPGAPGYDVARNYQLFRYMLACNAFGVHPTKFNGGMFTWDTVTDINGELFGSPDFRQWGPGLTLQNQRHMHWPMLRSGDYEMQAPMFNYFADTYKNTEQLVKSCFGHAGAMYSEYFNFYGLPSLANEYWLDDRKYADGSDVEAAVMGARLVMFEHIHQLDFSFMMLEQQRYSGKDISKYIPFIESSLTFYLEHYKMRYTDYCKKYSGGTATTKDGFDAQGKLVLYPSTGAETYKNVLNPTDVIDGLNCVLEGLIRLHQENPETYKNIDVAKWQDMLTRIPDTNMEGVNKDGKPIFLPGYQPGEMGKKSPFYQSETYTDPWNIEPVQLSNVFPYNRVSQGREGAERAINTTQTEFEAFGGGQKSHLSWSYYNLIITRLGMVKEAEQYANLKLGNGGYRFPSFWGPGHDFSPDHNWGGSGIYGLQEMALQSYEDVITPFATWPETWKGSFKLHAPEQTIVEGFSLKDGSEVAIMTLAESSKRDSISLQGEAVKNAQVFTCEGPVTSTYDEASKKVSFKVQAGKSYYVVEPK